METEGAVVDRELPFVVGVMGDFSADTTGEKKSLKERKFINIDRDNFNDVMQRMQPGVKMKVANTIANDGSDLSVELAFNSMEDFEPAKIVEQVDSLRKLKEARDKLRDLLTKSDRSDELESILEKTLQDQATLQTLAKQLGIETDS